MADIDKKRGNVYIYILNGGKKMSYYLTEHGKSVPVNVWISEEINNRIREHISKTGEKKYAFVERVFRKYFEYVDSSEAKI